MSSNFCIILNVGGDSTHYDHRFFLKEVKILSHWYVETNFVSTKIENIQ